MNYGLRFDHAARMRSALSPRINAVWEPGAGITFHAGYARLFTPPSFGNEADLPSQLPGTNAILPTAKGSLPSAEIDDYFDLGLQQKLDDLTVGLDAYMSIAKNLLAQAQPGSALFWAPYNFAKGRREGVELSATYAEGSISLWGNLALAHAVGKNIVSNQYYFTPAQLIALSSRGAVMDASEALTGSGGISYGFERLQISANLV